MPESPPTPHNLEDVSASLRELLGVDYAALRRLDLRSRHNDELLRCGNQPPGLPTAVVLVFDAEISRRVALAAHSMTWSARASSDGGIVRPRTLAVLRLITSSNLVGCSMGRSVGLA